MPRCQQRQLKGPNTTCISFQLCYDYSLTAWLSLLWRRERRKNITLASKLVQRYSANPMMKEWFHISCSWFPLLLKGVIPVSAWPHLLTFSLCWGCAALSAQAAETACWPSWENTFFVIVFFPAGLGELLWVTSQPYKRWHYHNGVNGDTRWGKENHSFWKSTFSNWLKIVVKPHSWVWTQHRYVAANQHIKLNAKFRRL